MSEEIKYTWYRIFSFPKSGKTIVPDGRLIKIQVAGRILFLANYKGTYYAGENKCPHAGAALHQGKITDCGAVECPYHRFLFDLKNGNNTSGEGYFLQTYPVRVEENVVYVGIPINEPWWKFW